MMCQRGSMGRSVVTSSTHREAIHAHGQRGSNQKSTVSFLSGSFVSASFVSAMPATTRPHGSLFPRGGGRRFSEPPRPSLVGVPDYTPPLRDIRFALEHVAGLEELATLAAFDHADPATCLGIVEEAGKFLAEVFGPLNAVGDRVGSVLR